jgi:hypothetical protein
VVPADLAVMATIMAAMAAQAALLWSMAMVRELL